MSVTKHLIISGSVQGVCYRIWTVKTAQSLELFGWVRNRSDGTVEVAVRGETETVDQFIESCRSGPEYAQVSNIDISDSEDDFPDLFTQQHSA